MKSELYKKALEKCRFELDGLEKPRGMEKIIQGSVHSLLPNSKCEVPLAIAGIKSPNDNDKGRVDIIYNEHAIELKVIRLPRLGSNASNALYDIGQISFDYWRLSTAKNINSAELLILLYGPLIEDLVTPAAIYREFHNRMFIDYSTSVLYGQIQSEKGDKMRKRQIQAIEAMGFNYPCNTKKYTTVVHGKYAIVSIPIS